MKNIETTNSDGYHTFDELYDHRHSLLLALMKSAPNLFWFSRRHQDGELCFGDGNWFIVGAFLPDVGQISYHLPIELFHLAQKTGANELEVGVLWDGHTSEDVSKRLKKWVELTNEISR
jgi:hypothetical protein